MAHIQFLNNYDFNEKSGLKEIDISEINEKGQIFKPNDVLLFELKDSSYKDTAAKCLYGNYEVLNSYIEYLKANNEFKDRQFYYIGIQEYNKSQILSDDIRSKIINQNKKGILKLKLYYFEINEIFYINYLNIKPEKLRILSILKDEVKTIKNKFIEIKEIKAKIQSLERNQYIIMAFLFFIILLLIIK